MKIFSRAFLYWAGERCLVVFATTILGGIGVGAGLEDVDWLRTLSVASVATIATLLVSVQAASPAVPVATQNAVLAGQKPLEVSADEVTVIEAQEGTQGLPETIPAGTGKHRAKH